MQEEPLCIICNTCKKEKTISDFPIRKDTLKGYRGSCKECTNSKKREWADRNKPLRLRWRKQYYANNKEIISKQNVMKHKRYRRLAKLDCIYHYSNGKNCCECCGENIIEFLAIDHINGGGKKQREEIKEYFPVYLKKKGYPEGYRILCHNCNSAIGYFGYCPHKSGSKYI